MSENKKNPDESTPIETSDCKLPDEEASTEEEQKKQKRDQQIISTAVDGVLSFFQVW